MKKFISSTIMIAMLTSLAFSQNLNQTEMETFTDIDNNLPLIGDTVVISGVNPEVSASTDANSNFSLGKAVSNDWKLIKQSKREQWSLYSRAYSDSKFLEFRVVGLVSAFPISVFNTAQKQLIDNENLPKGMKQTIIEQSNEGFLTYCEAKMPIMFKDRDLALQYKFHINTSGNSYYIDWVEVPEKAPVLKKGFIRIVSTRGKWEFTPDNDTHTLVTFTQHADMGGNIPAWIVNKMSGKTLVGDLLKLREMIAKTDNQQ